MIQQQQIKEQAMELLDDPRYASIKDILVKRIKAAKAERIREIALLRKSINELGATRTRIKFYSPKHSNKSGDYQFRKDLKRP
jgi:hypothetical protein